MAEKMSTTKVRTITAVVGTAILVPMMIIRSPIPFTLFMCFIAGLSAFEILRCASLKKWQYILILVPFAAILPALTLGAFEDDTRYLAFFALVSMAVAFVVLSISVFDVRKTDVRSTASAFAMILYITLGVANFLLMRAKTGLPCIVIFPFAIAWGGDTFAYFGGRLFGHRKLCPDVSPKKTVAGLLCAPLGSLFFAEACALVIKLIYQEQVQINFVALGLLSIVLSFVGAMGDLIASLYKRAYDVKDYGRLLPGHGGAMDRLDSILPVALIMYFAMYILPSVQFIALMK